MRHRLVRALFVVVARRGEHIHGPVRQEMRTVLLLIQQIQYQFIRLAHDLILRRNELLRLLRKDIGLIVELLQPFALLVECDAFRQKSAVVRRKLIEQQRLQDEVYREEDDDFGRRLEQDALVRPGELLDLVP